MKQKEIDSFATQDIQLALKAYDRGGASLYFGSPVEFRDDFGKQLGYQLGMNFSAYYPDFTGMSEIEVFVSKKGGYTDYHIDFQENFTVQLDGVKTWKLCLSDLKSPIGGFTPHYAKSGNLEHQLILHGLQTKLEYDKEVVEKNATEVVIEPGDFLYHPAGIWHSVKGNQDSCTINFSMKNINIAEIISRSLKHLMNSDDFGRQNLTFNDKEDFKNLINKGIDRAKVLL